MRTVERLFDEVSAALQFPYDFGENWPAFNECLAEMDWLPTGAGLVVVVLDAVEVLSESEVELDALIRSIEAAHSAYSQPIELGEWWDRPAVPFHVVLQSLPGDASVLGTRWQDHGATVSEFGP